MLIDVRWLQSIFDHWNHQPVRDLPQRHGATAADAVEQLAQVA